MTAIVLSISSLVISILVVIIAYIKLKSIYINLFNLSKGLDILFANQDKIIELTKLKSFIQLTNEEGQEVRTQIAREKEIFGKKRTEGEGIVRSSKSDTDDKES